MEDEIKIKTQRGLVVGRQNFIKELEEKLGRSLACLNPGRPVKKKSELKAKRGSEMREVVETYDE